MNLKSHYEPKILFFLRDHLFVTTRVAIKDGNFLISAIFDSDRPRHLFFRPTKTGFGAVVRFLTCVDLFFDVKNISFGKSEFFGRTLNKMERPLA